MFNLSTWATAPQPLGDWLAEELNQRYDVPKTLAQAWGAANALLPFLDGLDEVAAEHREACVEAINEFRYGVECIFLRKVGGGYIFAHRLLMEHVASLYVEADGVT